MTDEIETFVYLIGNRKRRLLKVGISKHPRTRLAQLRRSMPYELALFASVPFPSLDDALEFEAQMHFWLRHLRLRGEWFKLASTAEKFVACVEGKRSPTVHDLLVVLDVGAAMRPGEAARNAVAEM